MTPIHHPDKMADLLGVLFLGVVEGITEFLPISSTAHLLVTEEILGIRKSDVFNVVIQSGAVMAVVPAFGARVRDLLVNWRKAENRDYLLKLFGAFLITGIGGVVLEKSGLTLPDTLTPIVIALIVVGILFLVVEARIKSRQLSDAITWQAAVLMGLAQLVAAIFPGVSRSGACIIVGLCSGINRVRATEFAFLLGVPTMLAAGGMKLSRSLLGGIDGEPLWYIGVGFVTAFVSSLLAVKWLISYVQTHSFAVFGWYRILLGLLLALFSWCR